MQQVQKVLFMESILLKQILGLNSPKWKYCIKL